MIYTVTVHLWWYGGCDNDSKVIPPMTYGYQDKLCNKLNYVDYDCSIYHKFPCIKAFNYCNNFASSATSPSCELCLIPRFMEIWGTIQDRYHNIGWLVYSVMIMTARPKVWRNTGILDQALDKVWKWSNKYTLGTLHISYICLIVQKAIQVKII